MIPLVSLLTQFLLIALVAVAVVLGAAIGYLYLKARKAEDGGLSEAEERELAKRDREMNVIRSRIDEIHHQQQRGADTQHAMVQQQMEQLQQHIKARGRQIEGLQGQMRYEIEQRQAAMDEMRGQLRELVDVIRTERLALAAPPPRAETQRRDEVPVPRAPETPRPAASVTPRPTAEAPRPTIAEEPRPAAPESFSWEPVELDFGSDAPSDSSDDLLALFEENRPEHSPAPSPPPSAHPRSENPQFPVDDPFAASAASPWQDPSPQGAGSIDPFVDVQPSASAAAGPEDRSSDRRSSKFDLRFSPIDTNAPSGDRSTGPKEPSADPAPHQESRPDPLESIIQWTNLDLGSNEELPSHEPINTDPLDEDFSVYEVDFSSSGDGVSTEAAPSAPGAESQARSGDREDLTVLPMIDSERENVLHGLGVNTVEEIARWSRGDARRVAEAFRNVSEDTIMNEWVFAAQSVLFERYQSELRGRTRAI